jgi:hypothetical protein
MQKEMRPQSPRGDWGRIPVFAKLGWLNQDRPNSSKAIKARPFVFPEPLPFPTQ